MKQLYYAALLTGILLVSLVQANDEAELSSEKNGIQAAPLLSTGGSRHRLSTHKKSHRRKLLMDSLRNGLLDGSDDGELDDKIHDLGVDDEVDDERLLQKRKNGNNNKKKKIGNNNKKKKNNNNKKNGNNNKKKKSGNKKEKLIKQKIRNQKKEKKKEKQKDKKQELCLCEDLYGPDYWSTPSWNDYDDDWDSTLKRKQYKNSRNKKRNNGRLLLAAAEDEQEELHASFSGDDDVDSRRHLKADTTWGGDTWRKPKEKWCPCPFVPPEPTYAPTLSPSLFPTVLPTMYPTQDPTRSPNMEPTLNPTPRPTRQPTPFPTRQPAPLPTTKSPTARPSSFPTNNPTQSPTKKPVPGYSADGFNWGEKAAVGGPLGQTQSTPARFNDGIPISNITAGPQYTLHLNVDGIAFASGYVEALSAYQGQFGVGDSVTQGSNKNRQVNIVVRNGGIGKAPPFKRVYAGSDHSAFIDKNGQVYMTGSNSNGKLCLGDDNDGMKKIPHLVKLPPVREAFSVALGLDFTLILLNNGEVYACGSNRLGQIGLGDTPSVREPTLIAKRIKAVSAGGEFSLFLTQAGRAYSSGSNLYKQQCRDTEGNPVKIPAEIDTGEFSVLGIQGGSESSYLLLTDGKTSGIGSCGRNDEGQLCGEVTNARAEVKLGPSIEATGFGSGPTAKTVFFIGVNTTDASDVVYGCGQNDHDQVGIGSNQPSQINTPKRVSFSGSERFSLEISASSSHTVAIGSLLPSKPTSSPTASPSVKPGSPTKAPTSSPTKSPTSPPTVTPGPPSTKAPTSSPTKAPSTVSTANITDTLTLAPNDNNSDKFRFGVSVAISGTSALIGASTASEGGDEKKFGAAYLIENLFTSSITQTRYDGSVLPAPAPVPPDKDLRFRCGHSVALSNEYAVMGCPGFNVKDDAYVDNPGGAVVIHKIGFSSPIVITYDDDDAAEFGTSVSVNAAGILAVGTKRGTVFLYDLEQTSDAPFRTLEDNQLFDPSFGFSVALNDKDPPMLAVGAINQDKGSGAVFLWRNINTDPEEISAPAAAKEKCDTDKGCQFGFSVALFDQTLVVGSPHTQSNAGRAFVYDLDQENFEDKVQSLQNPPEDSFFGQSVAITKGAVVVGSRKYGSRGAAFFYNKNNEGKWYAPDFDSASKKQNPILGGSNGERFGNGVAISDTAFVVGAPYFSDFEGKAVAYSYTSAKNP
eukprot:CAMPEP_0113390962 /NCGR_PEP_ID=MMETSP0013_2-20120614/10456_1 /TAXON_ID=2843 ORGANISM="Skeletonema costatum, Strain 1716" /NCGR_SAMPLE_ID=MMETSP0013_2 /ASSEMBLY_ACC=CAM_ASM_000158 /LENGTH=1193 /DNA_ID=CAMNT_0000274173 /DNA_START=148 /DNA_END=3729 /DNA_ORIENTATION=+ /assembly_acc=CAM_ASM_000158